MHKDKINELDDYVQKNYKDIKRSANTICKSYTNGDVDDIIHDTYLKLRTKIKRDGFKGSNYGGYLWISIRNEHGMTLRKKQRNKTIYINDIIHEDLDYTIIVDNILLELDEQQKSSMQYDYDLMDITKELVSFVEKEFSEKEIYLFKNYYFIPKSTYNKLSKRTGYSITDCSIIMKKIKKEIRNKFIPYYKEKYNE